MQLIRLIYFRDMVENNERKFTEKKRFPYMYFTYAKGVPLLHILIMFLIQKFGDRKAIYYPGVGVKRCFLNGKYMSYN